jgi:hypothetical protein
MKRKAILALPLLLSSCAPTYESQGYETCTREVPWHGELQQAIVMNSTELKPPLIYGIMKDDMEFTGGAVVYKKGAAGYGCYWGTRDNIQERHERFVVCPPAAKEHYSRMLVKAYKERK